MTTTPFRLENFQGEVPRLALRQLADTQAQACVNFRMTSGRLDPLYYPQTVGQTVKVGGIKSLYRLYDATSSYWLSWLEDVDVQRGPIAGDASFRYYFTSADFEPRVSNLAMSTSAAPPYPIGHYVLGVTPPVTAPTAVHSAPSGAAETRLYATTLVTEWGEESSPSPASAAVVGTQGGTWTVTAPDVAPANTYAITAASWSGGVLTLTSSTSLFGLRAKEQVALAGFAPTALNGVFRVVAVVGSTFTVALPGDPGPITDGVGTATRGAPHHTANMVKRLYRSVTGSGGTAFYLVTNSDGTAYEVAASVTTMVDNSTKAIGEQLQTDTWLMPPADLHGLRVLPSGAFVGFSGNELCFSEPTAVYAWPAEYRITSSFPIVGIGVFGTSVVACTKGTPLIANGTDPAAMSSSKVDQPWPCSSKRSIVEMGYGVAWACPLGLVQVGVGGAQILTAAFYTEKEWAEINPESVVGAFHAGRYYGMYTVDADEGGLVILDGLNAQAVVTRCDLKGTALWSDPATGDLYIVIDDDVRKWDADTTFRMVGTWWSKEFVMPKPENLGAARLEGNFFQTPAEEAAYSALVAAQHALNALAIDDVINTPGSLNGASANAYSLNGSEIIQDSDVGDGSVRAVTFEMWVGGELFFSKTVNSDKTFKLRAGKAYDIFSVRVSGNVPIDAVLIGPTAGSLGQV